VNDSGSKHILSHHGESRAAVYRRLFQILWFGNQVEKLATGSSGVPTYVYPPEIQATVRMRFPDVQAGRRDAEFCNSDVKVYNVTWEDLANVKCPSPPKACKTCAVQTKKPY
jgi:hypothetical protein